MVLNAHWGWKETAPCKRKIRFSVKVNIYLKPCIYWKWRRSKKKKLNFWNLAFQIEKMDPTPLPDPLTLAGGAHYVLYNFTKRNYFKNYEKFYLRSFFCSRDIQFFVTFFLFLSTISKFRRPDETGIMTSWSCWHELANVIFGTTQKPFCIKLSKFPGDRSLKKKQFF